MGIQEVNTTSKEGFRFLKLSIGYQKGLWIVLQSPLSMMMTV